MLKELRVQNFALINRAEITFQNSFVVITGETGAGKSILLDAISLVLGGKSTTSFAFDNSQKTILEIIFDISKLALKDFFKENDLDYSEEIILRREITPEGKSRCFINDTLVNIPTLKALGDYLIDIHSQHQNLMINTPLFRYNFIDAVAGCLDERYEYTTLFKQLEKEKKNLEALIQEQQNLQKESDYTNYLLNELLDVKIQEGELHRVEEELNQLENAEIIIQQLSSSVQSLQETDINVIQLLTQIKNNLQSISKYNSKYEALVQRLQSNIIELKDIARESEHLLNDIEIDPERIEQLSTRVDSINKLLKKHNIKTEKELLVIQNELQKKISQYQNIDDSILEKKKQVDALENALQQKAQHLSEKRTKVRDFIQHTCTQLLKELAMPNAQFRIDIQHKENNELNMYGKDEIKFLFSANKGIAPSEVQKAVSGGEISRLMLAIKSIMAQHIHLPSILFDEIDTGVSGAVAGKMGDIMKNMSDTMQVIVITHLPQIAAKGQQHLYVYKKEVENKTITFIEELNKQNRVFEIAKMLSSGKPGEAAIQNAKELLNQA